MTKNIRIDDDVYTALKTRSKAEGKTISEVMRADMRASSLTHIPTEDIRTLELKIDELKSLFFETISEPTAKTKNKRPSRDLNPSRSLDRAP